MKQITEAPRASPASNTKQGEWKRPSPRGPALVSPMATWYDDAVTAATFPTYARSYFSSPHFGLRQAISAGSHVAQDRAKRGRSDVAVWRNYGHGANIAAGSETSAGGTASCYRGSESPVTGQILVQDADTILAKQDLVGQTVYAPDKAKIGAISDLILSQDAKTVEGFVIGVGGFLGIGEKSVALKIERPKTTPSEEGIMQLTMDVKKEELTNTPVFRSRKEMDAEKQAAERARNLPATPQPKN